MGGFALLRLLVVYVGGALMAQLSLIPEIVPMPVPAGETFEPKLDGKRLQTQMQAVHELMLDRQWRTIPQIALHLRIAGLSCTEASISARLRDLRKPPFGYTVERERIGEGFFSYRIAHVEPLLAAPAWPGEAR